MINSTLVLNPARLAAAQQTAEILNRKEAAAFLKIAPNTITKYVRRGAIPCRKVERRVIFSRRALERWAAGECVGPIERKTDATLTNDAPIMQTFNAGNDQGENQKQ